LDIYVYVIYITFYLRDKSPVQRHMTTPIKVMWV